MISQLISILFKPTYGIITLILSVLVLSIAIWLPNISLILVVFQTAPLSEAVAFLFKLYAGLGTNFTWLSASYTILIAILFGINTSLLLFYIKSRKINAPGMRAGSLAGLGGLISGALGLGCAACGTFILSSTLAIIGGASVIALLPFGGAEFGIIGVTLLSYSVYQILKKTMDPLVCEIIK